MSESQTPQSTPSLPEVTLAQIMDQVEAALDIDASKLDAEALRQGKIFNTIQRLYVEATNKLEKLAIQVDAVKHHRSRYYGGKLSEEVYKKEPLRESILKGDIESYLKIDAKVVEIKLKFLEQERIVKYLEEAKWRLKSRGEEIRLALDFQKFQLGI